MKRKFIIVLLSIGTVGGFASGIISVKRHGKLHRHHYETHVAQICVDAARRHEAGHRHGGHDGPGRTDGPPHHVDSATND